MHKTKNEENLLQLTLFFMRKKIQPNIRVKYNLFESHQCSLANALIWLFSLLDCYLIFNEFRVAKKASICLTELACFLHGDMLSDVDIRNVLILFYLDFIMY